MIKKKREVPGYLLNLNFAILREKWEKFGFHAYIPQEYQNSLLCRLGETI